MNIIAEPVQALTMDFPDQQTPPRLQFPDVARTTGMVLPVSAFRPPPGLMAKAALHVQRQAEVAGRHSTDPRGVERFVIIQHQVTGRLVHFLSMASHTAADEDRFDVTVIFDVENAPGET